MFGIIQDWTLVIPPLSALPTLSQADEVGCRCVLHDELPRKKGPSL